MSQTPRTCTMNSKRVSFFSLKYSSSFSSRQVMIIKIPSTVAVAVALLNVPPWCRDRQLSDLLTQKCGKVSSLRFVGRSETESILAGRSPPLQDTSATPGVDMDSGVNSRHFAPEVKCEFHDAIVVFKSSASLEKLYELKDSLVLCSEHTKSFTGMKKWVSDYKSEIVRDWDDFQKELDSFMIDYDKRKEEEEARLKEIGEEEDDEGWTTVTSKSKKPFVRNKLENQTLARAKAKKAAADKELLHFYKFQRKERKQDLIQNLRDKFEEDKKRVATMKAERKFRPY